MSGNFLPILIGVVGLAFAVIVIIYVIVARKANTKRTKYLRSLVQGTQTKRFSMEVFYQKFYIFCVSLPGLKRYTEKLRRRLEIINLGDEYLTRKETSKIMFRIVPTVIILTVIIILMTKANLLLMSTLLLLLVFLTETLISGAVDKIENKMLKDQINFFGEIRHSYHQFNMVEEAIYDAAQNEDTPEVGRQAERIHEILLADDPETELEKYYDIAPNDFLKEFAGISYLTREFGDRYDERGASLYLKNLNNITQEMQIEILKRDRLDYVFQSLSIIALLPVLFIEPVKTWAMGTFGFTKQFYEGKLGLMVQIFLIILTTISYVMVRKIKDNSSTERVNETSNPWQNKLYNKKPIKMFVDLFKPKKDTREHRVKVRLLKDSASKLKLEWMYINKITSFLVAFVLTILIVFWAHAITVDYVYTEPTADYDILGNLGDVDAKKAMEKTNRHNIIINKMKNLPEKKINQQSILKQMSKVKEFDGIVETDLQEEAETIEGKIKTVKNEYFTWVELLVALSIAFLAYYSPELMLRFQLKMRRLEMENEVMEYHTLILMLKNIERVNVEMILEWMERYSNIFRDPIARCVNNFESGGYEALEQLKNDVTFPLLIRIVESLQAAVDQIPIREAFDELETEREYYQERRKQSNERLIDRKARIGKVIGFAPMVTLFVGYLIVPMVGIGIVSMGSALSAMSTPT